MNARRLLGLATLALAFAAQGKVYRWVDAGGQVHYSDRVPAGVAANRRFDVPAPEPEKLVELEVKREQASARVLARNRLSGPVEVVLALSSADNVGSQPSLPLSRVLGAGEAVELARIDALDPRRSSGFELSLEALPGDPGARADDVVYSLPVDETNWSLGQGFHGGFSHEDEQNRYAVDLVVAEGTPVLAARGGVVIQVESGYRDGGTNRDKFLERANLIRILHDDGSMGLYAHLREDGALVRPGQRVGVGQQIGYAGNTGFSSGPHLHFAVQLNTGMRLVSVPFRMMGPNGFLPLRRN